MVAAGRSAMRILVIEDEPRILDFLRVGLEAEGFVVDGAEDGAVGLRARPGRAIRARRPRSAAAPARRPAAARTSCGAQRPELPVLILSARSDLPHEAARLRPRRQRLPGQAVLVRRARRTRPRAPAPRPHAPTATTLRAGLARARPGAPPGSGRRPQSSTSPTASSGCSTTCSRTPARSSAASGCCPRSGATAIDPGLERRRRLRAAAAQEARPPVARSKRCRHAGYRAGRGLAPSTCGLGRARGRAASR